MTSIRSATGLWFVAHIGLATTSLSAQALFVPEPDIRVAVNADLLRAKIAAADGWQWSGEYYRGGSACSSPDVHVELQRPALLVRGVNDLIGGAAALHLRITGTPKVYTRDTGCLQLGLSANCTVQGCTSETYNVFNIPLSAQCYAPFGVRVRQELPVRLPLRTNPVVTATLPPPGPGSGLEFGSLQENRWRAAVPPNKRSVLLTQTARALGGTDLRACTGDLKPPACDDDICSTFSLTAARVSKRDAAVVAVDTSVVPEEKVAVVDAGEAAARLGADETLLPGTFAGISFSQRLLRGDAGRNGLIQRLLPIRLFGTRKVSGHRIGYEAIVTDARVVPGTIRGSEALSVAFVVEQATAWEEGKRRSTEVKIDRISLSAIATLPRFTRQDSTAIVSLSVEQLKLTLSTKVGDVELCLDREDLTSALGPLVLPIARYVGPAKLLPDCLDVGDNNMTANRACLDDGERVGRMSADFPERNISLTLDLGAASSGYSRSGRWLLGAPSAR